MKRTEFPRTAPESVGISSSSVLKLLDRLESGFTEMHGIQIMRHGKICAEGWWSPYAPGLRHNLMSVTKTYASTAIGLAYTEGRLRLTDRVVDFFPDESPAHPDALLTTLRIRDVLCMGSGMESMPSPTADWIRDFIATPVEHTPGTRFMYNSVGSSLLGAIIRKVSGQGLHAYLKPRLFDKIGIIADNLRWGLMPDGLEAGGAGLYATTEDNLRLMKLYAGGGIWEGERILSEEYVKLATSKQIDTVSESEKYPFAKDSFCGYGFQIWMCRPQGVYRADGAMGQFSVVFPAQDMIISINETGRGIDGPQKTLDALWAFLEEIPDTETLSAAPKAFDQLQKRLAALSLPRPPYKPFSPKASRVHDKRFAVSGGALHLENQTLSIFCGAKLSGGISEFSFNFGHGGCAMDFVQDGTPHTVNIAIDGSRAQNKLALCEEVATMVCLSGAWVEEDTFTVKVRWIETSFEKDIHFCFADDGRCFITTSDPLMSVGPCGELNEAPVAALAI